MKKLILLFTASILLLVACQDETSETTLSVASTELAFGATDSGKRIVSIETNAMDWSITKSVEWVTVEKEEYNLLVSVEENTSLLERKGVITVSVGTAKQVDITVRQIAGEAMLSVTLTELEFAADDDNVQIVEVNTNLGAWEFTQTADWFTVNKEDNGFSVTAKRNLRYVGFTDTITVTAGSVEPVLIIVTHQARQPHTWANDPAMQEFPKAFPGAEGFGAMATGGRGGKVVAVTNLNDDGEGSFRWAMQQLDNTPVTVVFHVSGLIDLKSEIRVKKNNFTIAGQTAPGDGICIIGNKINFGGSYNFIIRHIRARQGRSDLYNNSFSAENGGNFIIDHCTFGWAPSEIMTLYDNDLVTVQWCLVHEALDRSFGCQWGGERTTYHHNLLTHNENRNPRFNGARATSGSAGDRNVLIEYVNNVHYNWGRETSCRGHDIETVGGRYGNSNRTNMVSNYWKPGPARPDSLKTVFTEVIGRDLTKFPKFYMNDNFIESKYPWAVELNNNNYLGLRLNDFGANGIIENFKSDVSFVIPQQYQMVKIETAHEAYESVLARVGAFPRDAQELRIINEVRTGTTTGLIGGQGKMLGILSNITGIGGHPTYKSLPALVDTDGDGIPDEWERVYGLGSSNADDAKSKNVSGTYTNLEVYLHELAQQRLHDN